MFVATIVHRCVVCVCTKRRLDPCSRLATIDVGRKLGGSKFCKFQWLSRLGSVTARQSSSEHQPNFAVLNRGRHLCLQGDHHVGHWPTFLVFCCFLFDFFYQIWWIKDFQNFDTRCTVEFHVPLTACITSDCIFYICWIVTGRIALDVNRRTLCCCISLLCCCYLDDECDEDMLCALLETDDNRLDEGSITWLLLTVTVTFCHMLA